MRRERLAVSALCACAFLFGVSGAVRPGYLFAAEPAGAPSAVPANSWVKISDGKMPPQVSGIYAKPVFVGDSGEAVLRIGGAGNHLTFRAAAGKYEQRTGEFPAGNKFGGIPASPLSGTYLSGLKKLLFIFPNARRFSKKSIGIWLLDPASGKWEVQEIGLVMHEKDTDYNPSGMRSGWPVPVWGDLIYDPVNREAVAFGGAVDFGRVSREKEPVQPGDWVYDETAEPKRLRRLLEKDKEQITEARKWYSAHAGTWTFSEETGKWAPTPQPMRKQPPGRILSQMAFDEEHRKIVLFGGDDRTRCLSDTWVYDCTSRTWTRAEPKTSPPARAAHALVYVPEAKAVLLAGGYGGGWRRRKDAWAYSVAENRWVRLAAELPEPVLYSAGYYDPGIKAAVVVTAAGPKRNKSFPAYALRLDLASAAKGEVEKTDPAMDFHCKARSDPREKLLPDDWLKGKGAPEPRENVLARLKSLPANKWVNMNPPYKPDPRGWGSYVYDVRTHRAFAWGGGHSTYSGADVTEYHLAINRWVEQKYPPNYYPRGEHARPVGMPGVTFFGKSVLPCHARKAYGIDPISRSLILWPGDVYDLEEHCVIAHIGPCPPVREKPHPLAQPAYLTTDHGLYAYYNAWGKLYKADVAAGIWRPVADGGPKVKSEWAHVSWDSKRDRLIYMDGKHPGVHAYSFRDKAWKREEGQGGDMAGAIGDSAYVKPMDAVLLVCNRGGKQKGAVDSLYFYKLDERRWYSAPSTGDPFAGANFSSLNKSPFYDPELGLVVRVTSGGHWSTDVHVMRLVPEELKLTPVAK